MKVEDDKWFKDLRDLIEIQDSLATTELSHLYTRGFWKGGPLRVEFMMALCGIGQMASFCQMPKIPVAITSTHQPCLHPTPFTPLSLPAKKNLAFKTLTLELNQVWRCSRHIVIISSFFNHALADSNRATGFDTHRVSPTVPAFAFRSKKWKTVGWLI